MPIAIKTPRPIKFKMIKNKFNKYGVIIHKGTKKGCKSYFKKHKERNYENQIIPGRLYCEHKGCYNYIKGVEGYNGAFFCEGDKQSLDLRNQMFYCDEHAVQEKNDKI